MTTRKPTTIRPFPRLFFAATCALAVAGAAACEDGSTPNPAPNSRVEAGLQQVLDQAVVKPGVLIPGAIAYYRDPTHAPWSGSAGLGELQARVPMRATDRIRAGSIVKTFLATVTLQMVEEGRLSLDQTLPELLPRSVTDRVANAERISLRMLLNHTSGIPEWVNDQVHVAVAREPGRLWSTDEAIDIAAGVPATFPPGTSWSYSNTNYTLVGLVLERTGGRGWRAQVRERVLARLGLTSTHLPEPGDVTVPGAYAHGYVDVDGMPVDLSTVDPSMAGASGGNAMITTVQDLARFLDALLAGRLFARPETLAAMTTMIDAPDDTGLPHRYGFGLESFELGGATVIGHAGGAVGYAVMMFQIPARATTLVTAVNTGDLFANALEVFIPSLDVITAPAPAK
jgi:D-alanyl-D-alanine carboxypeptidase